MADDYSKIRPGTLTKTNSSTTVPAQLTTDESIRCTSMMILGMKSARVNNTGQVWLQVGSGDNTGGIPIQAGGAVSWTAPSGKDIKLSDLYIDVESANDGVVIVYQ